MQARFQAARSDRLDKLVAAGAPSLTRSAARKLIEAGHVRVAGLARDPGDVIRAGAWIEIDAPDPEPAGPLAAENIPLRILFEDDALLVIDKPAGMVVHPGAGVTHGTVANAILSYAPEAAGAGDDQDRPGIVHRLDKETSGVLLIARTEAALRGLQAQFKARQIEKTYLAWCVGDVQPATGLIDKPIGRDPGHRQRMAIVNDGRAAQTAFVVTERLKQVDPRRLIEALGLELPAGAVPRRDYSLVRAQPRTGRTHQIRVHLASLGFPVVGDAVYGATRHDPLSKALTPRHLLHASQLRFAHPITGAPMTLHAAMPADFLSMN
ncbi:MAG: RluA family pseudouridine synthase [Thermoflexales bacterium]|nr:RluA family pseudouridine synthase [Thermoflexales bacterium]